MDENGGFATTEEKEDPLGAEDVALRITALADRFSKLVIFLFDRYKNGRNLDVVRAELKLGVTLAIGRNQEIRLRVGP